jgi:glycosyltransferase involved in cell wall biosynthesis
LLVEYWAHLPLGHFPKRFVELAAGYTEAGCRVDVLTSQGWHHQNEGQPVDFTLRRFGRLASTVDRIANWLLRLNKDIPGGPLIASMGRTLRVVALTGAIRSLRRDLDAPYDDVVVLAYDINVLVASAIAGPGRWLFYTFGAPADARRRRQMYLFGRLARRAEQRRRRHGGRASVATPFEGARQRWHEIAAFLDPRVLPIAGCWTPPPIPTARLQLGLDPGERIALMFGVLPGKNSDVVWQTFAPLTNWRLLVGGQVTDSGEATVLSRFALKPALFPGSVSPSIQSLLFAAADVVILSFMPNYLSNSGTLMDALSWGLPVVCSEQSAAADLVTKFSLGATFTPGDSRSLSDALRIVPTHLSAECLDVARQACSNLAVAKSHLHALETARVAP